MHAPTLADFEALRGERFMLALGPGEPVSAQLVEAQPLPQPPLHGRQPFSLVFSGPPVPVLPQCIYQVAHQRMAPVDIFLVPVAADASGVRYQAVFS